MKVSIIGTGYVGLVSGLCLAETGHDVTCVDIDEAKVEQINRGSAPIFEAGLDGLLRKNLGTRFRASVDAEASVLSSDVTMLAVGTPGNNGEIDLKYIRQAAASVGRILREKEGYHLVVVKSTVVPGTTEEVVLPLIEAESGLKAGRDFGIGMNPEFLREGQAVEDFMNPDRIVLGGVDERSCERLRELYAPFSGAEVLVTTPRTAEAIKYAANALLATLVSFSNEIGNLCATLDGVDVVEVMRGVHLDRRISPKLGNGSRIQPGLTSYLEAGCGFGGSCFPKDLNALVAYGRKSGVPLRVLEAVIEVNRQQPRQVMTLLRRQFASLSGLDVAVLGVAFKAGTSDVRESPSLPIIEGLADAGALVTVFDPVAADEAVKCLGAGRARFASSLEEAVAGKDAVVLLTRWPEFGALPELLSSMAAPPLLVDGRRMIDKRRVPRYAGVGLRTRANGGEAIPVSTSRQPEQAHAIH